MTLEFLTKKKVMKFIDESLRNPMCPDSCCLYGLCFAVVAVGKMEDRGPSRKLSEGALRFLGSSPSSEAHAALMKHICVCRCNLGDADVRRLHPSALISQSSMTTLDEALYGISCLWDGTGKHKLAGYLRGMCNASEDYTQIIESLLRWAATPPYAYDIFSILRRLLEASNVFTRALLSAKDLPLYLEHLKAAIVRCDAQAPPQQFAEVFIGPVLTVTSFLKTLENVDTIGQVQMLLFPHQHVLREVATQLLQILYRNRTTHPEVPALAGFWAKILHGASSAISAMEMGRDLSMSELIAALDEMVMSPKLPADQDPHEVAFAALMNLRLTTQCMNVQCTTPTTDHKTRTCAGCGVVRYCNNQTCQVQAWRDARTPHKALCRSIKSLRQSMDLEGDKWTAILANVGRDAAMDFRRACIEHSVDPRLTESISCDIMTLTLRKPTAEVDSMKPVLEEIERRYPGIDEEVRRRSRGGHPR